MYAEAVDSDRLRSICENGTAIRDPARFAFAFACLAQGDAFLSRVRIRSLETRVRPIDRLRLGETRHWPESTVFFDSDSDFDSNYAI